MIRETKNSGRSFLSGRPPKSTRNMQNSPEVWRAKASPALLANSVTGGRWKIYPHLDYLDDCVLRLVTGKLTDAAGRVVRTLLVSMPPQHGKSEYLSRWLPCWYLGTHPADRVMHASYGDRYSQKWGRAARSTFAACSELFGVDVSDEKAEMREWEIARYGGSMFSAGVGGEFTGRAADLLIVDDPHKNAEDAVSEISQEAAWTWWQSVASTRRSSIAPAIVVGTRWHRHDLIGRIAESHERGDLPVFLIRFRAFAEEGEEDPLGRKVGEALCPELKSPEFLESQRASMSAYWWNSLYQGRPTTHERAEFPAEYFDHTEFWTDEIPHGAYGGVVAIDPSKGKNPKRGDYSAAAYVGVCGDKLFVDADVERRPVPDAVSSAISLARKYAAREIAYESNGFQELIGAEFGVQLSGSLHGINLSTIVNTASKDSRIQSLAGLLKQRAVVFLDGSPGVARLVSQLREYPMAAHDDGPDSLEMGIRRVLEMCASDAGPSGGNLAEGCFSF